ncbi:MAG: hypothetical protein M1832_000561 [Thelocarpon impressellum]|nr:MAG: hypothetical protein M1832_000561 [Thelocarpon impressellum]
MSPAASSATPTPSGVPLRQAPSYPMSNYAAEFGVDRDGLQPPRTGQAGRSMSNSSVAHGTRNQSFAMSAAPGSFSSDLRSTLSSRAATPRPDAASTFAMDFAEEDGKTASERIVVVLTEQLKRELKIKEGSENLLEALNMKKAKQTKEQRSKVELELTSSNRKIAQLQSQLEELRRPKEVTTPPRSRMSSLFRSNASRSSPNNMGSLEQDDSDDEAETESPTFALAEILQSLEVEGMQPDYYVERSNSLVELFKRHPTLKYDLAWSVFGLRVQTMLLSDSKEVVAAGYRVARYAITDRNSLQTIRNLNTDYLVVLSLVKEGKASVEREQALKFIRAFLDVKDGVREVSRAVVRTMVAVAEHSEDRLRSICIETLAEILIRDPPLLISAGGMGPLTEILGDGSYEASESLVTAFLYLLDMPRSRQYLRPGHGLEVVFYAFTDPLSSQGREEKLKANARVIAATLRTWSGLMALSMYDFRAIRSLISSLQFPGSQVRDIILDLLFEILRIKPPSWSSSFLAGRRLTTYNRVANLKSEALPHSTPLANEENGRQRNLIEHYLALVLAVVLEAGLLKALLSVLSGNAEPVLRRKATLLLGEVLKMASWMLPGTYSAKLQMLPELFSSASNFTGEHHSVAANTVYQIDSVNRTLFRSGAAAPLPLTRNADLGEHREARQTEPTKTKVSPQIDEAQFRSLMLESQVLSTANHSKWRWDVLQGIAEGPLLNPKRLDEAIKATKFLKRLVGFYRPFKYRFADVKNTKPNQRYVRIGCTLVKTLLQTSEGVRYLVENKLLRQLAECLAQLDHMSGLTSMTPLFSPTRLSETLSGGYFAILGVLGSDAKGLIMLERWKMINMCYHIVELDKRPDLVRTLLGHMDFSLNSHFRVMLSKALTASPKDIRIFATILLRKYATSFPHQSSGSTAATASAEWAIRLLVTQLYDPEVEVCETAVKILEEACNGTYCLEYVVKCRPALDHLGEIGAPLLLRFLSTSTGYHYLNDLDYITQEMDDWFLGRNDTYVTLVEASLARAMHGADKPRRDSEENSMDREESGMAPPHFYRELTRTAEGCRLLRDKGHFDEFVMTISNYELDDDDAETVVKVKGCLWAVGNVGSMELGAPFLEESDVVQSIVEIARKAQVLTLRGTAFFALGLISQSIHGLEILDEFGWDGATNAMGLSLGLCIPMRLGSVFSIEPWPHKSEKSSEADLDGECGPSSEKEAINVRILELIVDLGNTVLTKKAVSDLMHIKAKKPPGFGEPRLFHKVMMILERHHYRLPVRRFVIDLFEKSVMRRLVLDEESDDDGDATSDDGETTTT